MIRYAIIGCFLLCWTNVSGQNCNSDRYLENIFQSSVSQNVVYGNAPAITAVYVAESVTVDQDLTMDIFFPVGDHLPKRPAVILAYGGGFLLGSKEDEDVWTTCDSLAKKGYVTASINYRMNMNVASSSSAVRAIYRAAQDYSAALRYMKEYSDALGIDTNYIFVGGVSAGGFSAMHMAFMDENERPSETYQSGLLGMNPDLGCMSCEGNSFKHSLKVRGIVNLWGAVMDTSYIQVDEVMPMTLFHGTADPIVPYIHGFPFTALFLMPEVYGSASIAARMTNLGGHPELNLFQGVGHNIWGVNINNQLTPGPTEHWVPITDSIISFLFENIRPATPLLSVLSPVCQNDTVQVQIGNIPAGGRPCWSIDSALVVSASPDSSQLSVVWPDTGLFNVSVVVFNHLDAVSEPASVQVLVSPSPAVSIAINGNVLTASGQYASYQWYLDGISVAGADQATFVADGSGLYTVQAINQWGCSAISDAMAIVGVGEVSIGAKMPDHVAAYDLCGRLIARMPYSQWQVSSFANGRGIIIIEMFSEDDRLISREKRVSIR